MAKVRTIRIEDLVLDSEVNIRSDLDEPTVLRYMEVWDQLPPVTVVDTGSEMLLVDGFHRTEAALRLGKVEEQAEVVHGDRNLAIQMATVANMEHGLPLHQYEMEYAAWRLHRKLGLSLADAAKLMHSHRSTVSNAVRAYETRQRLRRPDLGRTVAAMLARAPAGKQRELLQAAEREGWGEKTIQAVARQLRADPTLKVADIANEAVPHLQHMRDRIRYRRTFDQAMTNMKHLDQLGVTPARLVATLDDPGDYDRWKDELKLAIEYLQQVQAELGKGGLRVVR